MERVLPPDRSPECFTLGVFWKLVKDAAGGWILRPSRDAAGEALLPTREELQLAAEKERRAATEAERAATEAERAAVAQRDAALARVHELEAELAKRR